MPSPRGVVLAWVSAFTRRDADAAADLSHPHAVSDQVAGGPPTVGREAMREGFRCFFRAPPDNVTTPVNLVCGGEGVALEWEGGATWRGERVPLTPLPARERGTTPNPPDTPAGG